MDKSDLVKIRLERAQKAKERSVEDWGKEYWSKVQKELRKSLN